MRDTRCSIDRGPAGPATLEVPNKAAACFSSKNGVADMALKLSAALLPACLSATRMPPSRPTVLKVSFFNSFKHDTSIRSVFPK